MEVVFAHGSKIIIFEQKNSKEENRKFDSALPHHSGTMNEWLIVLIHLMLYKAITYQLLVISGINFKFETPVSEINMSDLNYAYKRC